MEKENKIIKKTPEETRLNQRKLQKEYDNILDEFRKSFDDLMEPFFPMPTFEPFTKLSRQAPLDFIDNGNTYTITADLPGYNKDNIDVQVTKEGLTIKAETKQENEEKTKNYLHRERTYSSMQRYIAFPEEVLSGEAEACMNEGVLEIKVPKKEPKPEEQPRKLEVK
jgi:HSP20 family protein